MLESKFKRNLINKLENRFPGCVITHLDPNDIQGIGDLLILYGPKWAVLEGKRSINSPVRPNQEYYINLFNKMSFASFISPDNEEEVLDALQFALRSPRRARLSRPK